MSSVVSSQLPSSSSSSLRRYERKERHVEGELEAGRLWERAQPRGACCCLAKTVVPTVKVLYWAAAHHNSSPTQQSTKSFPSHVPLDVPLSTQSLSPAFFLAASYKSFNHPPISSTQHQILIFNRVSSFKILICT